MPGRPEWPPWIGISAKSFVLLEMEKIVPLGAGAGKRADFYRIG
jgi:hypothetical protein